jgi:hypothetical protein
MRLQRMLEGARIKALDFKDIKNVPELHKRMKEISRGNTYAWTASTVFGLTTLTAWKNPSSISHLAIGDTPLGMQPKGYYQSGIFYEFSGKLLYKHQQIGMGSDR